jgi:hypothetical protein
VHREADFRAERLGKFALARSRWTVEKKVCASGGAILRASRWSRRPERRDPVSRRGARTGSRQARRKRVRRAGGR